MADNDKVHVTFLEYRGVVREFKKACVDKGVSMRDVLHEAILNFLGWVEAKEKPGKFIILPTTEQILAEIKAVNEERGKDEVQG